jgi:hypothetical protein
MHRRWAQASRFIRVKRLLFFSLALTFLLTACGREVSNIEGTPTPFPVQIPAQRITTAAPIPISLKNLAANPDFYIGATLQLSGQFRRLPFLACEGKTYSSPATWGLEDNGFLANAAGMDTQLRSLLEEGQPITVEGRWLKYEGEVGCEDHIQDQTIWYLSTDRVLDPHPLIRQQENPIAEEVVPEEIAAGTEATTSPTVPEVATETQVPATVATVVPSSTPIIPDATAVITATATFTPIPSITTTADSMTPTLAGSPSPPGTPNGSPSPTANVAATPTVTITPGASTTPSNTTSVEKGALTPEDLIISNLAPGSMHKWTLDLQAGDAITITVAPATASNIVLSLFDSNNVVQVNEQNSAAAGEPETIINFSISNPGIHTVQVRTVEGTQTDYALMFMDAESYSFIFKGRLSETTPFREGNLEADTDHFWFFDADNGESLSFEVAPSGNGDPYVELYDPGGSRLLTIDENDEGEAESLNNYTLLDGGMYGIRVAEFDFQPMAYTLRLLPSN